MAAVLDRLSEVGLVDDHAYAQMLVRSQQAGRGLARNALARELHTAARLAAERLHGRYRPVEGRPKISVDNADRLHARPIGHIDCHVFECATSDQQLQL
jgi:hypothetical protein